MANSQIIDALNGALKAKLTAINQYFLHARMLKHQGEVKLADDEYKASLEAMKHSDMLVEQILRLGGKPDLQELHTLAIGDSSTDMLKNDLKLAEAALRAIETALLAAEGQDAGTAQLLARIRESQQERIQYLFRHIQPLKECA